MTTDTTRDEIDDMAEDILRVVERYRARGLSHKTIMRAIGVVVADEMVDNGVRRKLARDELN